MTNTWNKFCVCASACAIVTFSNNTRWVENTRRDNEYYVTKKWSKCKKQKLFQVFCIANT